MKILRLLTGLEWVVEKIPQSAINMHTYRANNNPIDKRFDSSDAKELLSCGTVGCLAGWMATCPELQKEGFNFSAGTVAAGAPPNKTSRSVSTNVLVDNGSTVVLGVIYQVSEEKSHQGIPFLKDLPLFGWLFRTQNQTDISKTELIIFLTPRIINQEEAGLVEKEDTLT